VSSFKFKFKFSQSPKIDIKTQDRLFIMAGVAFLLMTAASLFILFYFFEKLPSDVPFFYSRVWGEARLAPKYLLVILPLGNFFLGIFNLGYSLNFLEKEIILARILQGITVILSILTLLGTINIIKIIT